MLSRKDALDDMLTDIYYEICIGVTNSNSEGCKKLSKTKNKMAKYRFIPCEKKQCEILLRESLCNSELKYNRFPNLSREVVIENCIEYLKKRMSPNGVEMLMQLQVQWSKRFPEILYQVMQCVILAIYTNRVVFRDANSGNDDIELEYKWELSQAEALLRDYIDFINKGKMKKKDVTQIMDETLSYPYASCRALPINTEEDLMIPIFQWKIPCVEIIKSKKRTRAKNKESGCKLLKYPLQEDVGEKPFLDEELDHKTEKMEQIPISTIEVRNIYVQKYIYYITRSKKLTHINDTANYRFSKTFKDRAKECEAIIKADHQDELRQFVFSVIGSIEDVLDKLTSAYHDLLHEAKQQALSPEEAEALLNDPVLSELDTLSEKERDLRLADLLKKALGREINYLDLELFWNMKELFSSERDSKDNAPVKPEREKEMRKELDLFYIPRSSLQKYYKKMMLVFHIFENEDNMENIGLIAGIYADLEKAISTFARMIHQNHKKLVCIFKEYMSITEVEIFVNKAKKGIEAMEWLQRAVNVLKNETIDPDRAEQPEQFVYDQLSYEMKRLLKEDLMGKKIVLEFHQIETK